jgi:alpha-soluble NSF attachment protein
VAIQALYNAIAHLKAMGRWRQAADRMKDIANLYLQLGDLRKAASSFEQAGEWYAQEEAAA